LRVFPRVRALPYPALSLAGVGFYFPILVFAVGAASVFRGIRRGATAVRGTGFAALLPVLLWGVLSLLHVRVRSDEAHLLAPLVPAVVLFVLLVGRTGSSGCPHPVWRGALVIVAALTFLKPVTGQVMFLLSARERTGGYCLRVSRARGIRMPEGGALYDALARYVHARVPRGREIFVGNLRHDRIAINDVLLYFLSGRDSATHYHELHPGVATTGPVQERIVRELEEAEVPLIVLGPFDNTEPSLGGQSSGVRRLDRYLRERFRPEARFGTYEVWTRREF